MNEELLAESIRLVGKLADRGDYADALVVMAPWADAGLPDLQKTVVAHNVASLYRALQQPVEALAWYDWGLPIERGLQRTRLAEAKADLLAQLGRAGEAAALLQSLLAAGDLAAEDRARIEAAHRAVGGR